MADWVEEQIQGITLGFRPLPLTLRAAFGTSHSTTTNRKNGLVIIKIGGGGFGYGECGLPPKKPGVYHADYQDCLQFFRDFVASVNSHQSSDAHKDYNPFSSLPSERNYFPSQPGLPSQIRFLFYALDQMERPKEGRVCAGAIEHALLDLWGQAEVLPLYKLISPEARDPSQSFKAFFTVSLNEDLSVVSQETEIGLAWTPNIKIKLNDSIEIAKSMLDIVLGQMEKHKKEGLLCLDANAAWTPEIAIKYLEILVPIKEKIFMVEQPFPVETSDQWKQVKEEYTKHGISIYADESVSNSDDIETMKQYAHGVNVKLDKTGGIREALRTIEKAKAADLKLWIGIMISSQLSVTTASHLMPHGAFVGDLDGSLLITEATNLFDGGCQIVNGEVILSEEPGIGVYRK